MERHTLEALSGLYLSSATRGPKAPRTIRLDSDGVRVSVTVPGPGALVGIPGLLPVPSSGVYRTGTSGVVLADGSGLDVLEIRDRLVEALSALPERPDASPAYGALRRLFLESEGFSREYALEVVKAWRRSLEKPPKPEPKRAPGPRRDPVPDAERKRRSREQQRADEEESALWFLRGWLAGRLSASAPAPGMRVPAPALRRKAEREISTVVDDYDETLSPEPPGGAPEPGDFPDLEAFRAAVEDHDTARALRGAPEDRLAEWLEYAEEEGYPLRPRIPRRGVFFSLADEVLGARSVYGGQQVYTIPDTSGGTMPDTKNDKPHAFAEAVLERVARLAWEENRDALTAYLEQVVEERDRREQARDSGGRFAPAADGTTVVDLDSRRRR